MPDAFSLGFDTSAAHCAAALIQGDRLLAQAHEDMARGQPERLFPLLGELLAGAGVDWRDLSVIGCGTGPGNFTGIRHHGRTDPQLWHCGLRPNSRALL